MFLRPSFRFLVFLFFLCGYQVSPISGLTALALAAQPGEIRIMSYNIRYGTAQDGINHWEKRKEFLAQTIRAFDPDLLGTQETLGFQKEFLSQKFPTHEAWGVGREDGNAKGEMAALYFRKERFEKLEAGHFWLSETPEKAGTKSWDSALPRMVSWVKLKDRANSAAPAILFLNTHFDHRGEKARVESAKLIRSRMETLGKDCSVILAGDFNVPEGSGPYKTLFQTNSPMALELRDTYRVVQPERKSEEGTFTDFLVSQNKGDRIDWIACSKDWKVTQATIDRTAKEGRTPSDHFPVTATLLRGEQPKKPVLSGGAYSIKEIPDIAYVDGPDADPLKHKLDLFLPEGIKNYPVLFFIHGGSWTTGDRRLYGAMGRLFAKNGVGVVVISYRLSPKVQHPAHIQDVAKAFAWTIKNIANYGGRSDRVFVCGHSAGAHLGALLATNPSYLKEVNLTFKDIRGVIPLSGVFTLLPGTLEKVLGKDKEAAWNASPSRFVCPECPPFEILYAEKDYKNFDIMAEEFHKDLCRKGVPSRCTKVYDRNHISIMVHLMTDETDPVTQALLEFIARHSDLKLSPLKK